jgi:hypothetical protein
MQNPSKTLLYDLFAAPILRVLQKIVDWVSGAATAVSSDQSGSHKRNLAMKIRQPGAPLDTRSHWEKMGVVAPVYKLAGQGLSDRAIALSLNLSENTVYECIAYLVRRLKCQTRAELVLYASPSPKGTWNIRTTPRMLISGVRRWRQRKLADSLLTG